ncbi:transporter, partial [Streptomyces sp. B-S-A6]|nr:transporter [Streptomyces sp. B-S-A6]
MSGYWPWWAGAAGLALITVYHALSTDRSFGVSSAWDRVLHWRRERQLERMDAEFTDENALAEALAAATAEHFGTASDSGTDTGTDSGSGSAAPTAPPVPYEASRVDQAGVKSTVGEGASVTSQT